MSLFSTAIVQLMCFSKKVSIALSASYALLSLTIGSNCSSSRDSCHPVTSCNFYSLPGPVDVRSQAARSNCKIVDGVLVVNLWITYGKGVKPSQNALQKGAVVNSIGILASYCCQ